MIRDSDSSLAGMVMNFMFLHPLRYGKGWSLRSLCGLFCRLFCRLPGYISGEISNGSFLVLLGSPSGRCSSLWVGVGSMISGTTVVGDSEVPGISETSSCRCSSLWLEVEFIISGTVAGDWEVPAILERVSQKQNAAVRGSTGWLDCGWFMWFMDSFCIGWNRRTVSIRFTNKATKLGILTIETQFSEILCMV